MNDMETAELLALATAFDERVEWDVAGWHAALSDLPWRAARDAVITFYRRSERQITAADIRRHIEEDR